MSGEFSNAIPNFHDIYLTDGAGRRVKVIAWTLYSGDALLPIVWDEVRECGVLCYASCGEIHTKEPKEVDVSWTEEKMKG